MFSPLPFPLGSLVGREFDLDRIDALLADGARLITVTGLGGVGKTRLAIAAGHRVAARGLATAYCDAGAVDGVTEFALALAQALALELGTGPRSQRVMSALASALAARPAAPTVIVIDNFEELVRLPDESAVLGLCHCLERTPWLSALVTSRIALSRAVGVTVAVLPIDTCGPASPAVRLLTERAAQVAALPAWRVEDPTLERLAARLEGLPLALELAAARAHLVAPRELLTLLDERLAAGHDSDMERMRDAVVAWSWGVLTAEQREALRRLEVVEGSFDLELATALIEGTRGEVLAKLEALARVSLVMVEPSTRTARYRLLEAVREFVRERAPHGRREALDSLSEALLARLPDDVEVTLVTRFDPGIVLAERERFLAIVRRGLRPEADLRALTLALRASSWLLLALRRSGFGPALGERVDALLEHPDIERVPLPIRLSAAMLTVTMRISDARTGEVDALLARIDRWAATASDERPRIRALALRGQVAHYRWDFHEVYRIGQQLVSHPLWVTEPTLCQGATQFYVNGRRALGLSDFASDDALAAQVAARLVAAGEVTNALNLQCNRAFHAVHMGHPALALALCRELESAAVALAYSRLLPMAQRERARAELDMGLRSSAIATFDGVVAMLPGTREAIEAQLERAATALEAGRHDEVRRDLAAVEPLLATSFEVAYHTAIARALAVLAGEPFPVADARVTGTIEDTAFRLLAGLAESDASAIAALRELARTHAPSSFRVRQALRLFEAAQGLIADDPNVLAVDFEAQSFRLGAHWVRLDKRPLLSTLLEALALSRAAGEPGVGRSRLLALCWPDTRIAREHLVHRLETAVSALRKLGLHAIVACATSVTGDAGYSLDPTLTALRVNMSAWVHAEPPVARGRGRRPAMTVAPAVRSRRKPDL